ncbi:MAG: excisionase family DNA-binding protein [Patescibacteria group bacterium]|nr:excisionase family DNA-binding protein [Patescibacteria group bacterium]
MKRHDLISVKQASEITGYSRMHIIRLIKEGKIKAERIGRSYAVYRDSLGDIYKEITQEEKERVHNAVDKVIKDYSETLKKLGKE